MAQRRISDEYGINRCSVSEKATGPIEIKMRRQSK